jgi:hypothetical protein
MNKNLFLAGMAKCGTTALAAWFVRQGLVEPLVPGNKEPYIYARADFGSFPFGRGGTKDWLLDASAGYALNPAAIARMPEHGCRIVLCFRNPWERIWSSYKMHRLAAMKKSFMHLLPAEFSEVFTLRDISLLHFPAKSRDRIENYLAVEGARLREGNFLSRLCYERDFLHTYHKYPLRSSLEQNSFRFALGNILAKFAPQNVFVVSLPRLRDAALRNRFIHDLLGVEGAYPEIQKEFVLENTDIGEEKPDFTRPEFDGFRSTFHYDLQEFEKLIESAGIVTDYLDFDALRHNIV